MSSLTEKSFGDVHFGNAQLGDARRTKRLIKRANIIARHPGGSLPDKFKSPKDLKAFYRLCDRPEVTHGTILNAHRQVTFDRIRDQDGPVLGQKKPDKKPDALLTDKKPDALLTEAA